MREKKKRKIGSRREDSKGLEFKYIFCVTF